MYNKNIQQNPQCVESCLTKEFPISTRFSPAFFIVMKPFNLFSTAGFQVIIPVIDWENLPRGAE